VPGFARPRPPSESTSRAPLFGPYVAYALGYLGFVLVVSPVATALVVNAPVVGLPVGILGGGVVGLAANITTMRFVPDLDPASSVAASWPADGAD